MIIFTITNTVSQQVYVGSTRNDIDSHWETLLIAAESGVEAELYNDIRNAGAHSFALSEYGFAENLSEARELTADALETFNGKSLQGLITKPKPSKVHRQSAEERKAALALLEEAEQKALLKGEVVKPSGEVDLKLLAQQRDAELEARIARERQETRAMNKVLAAMDSRKRGGSAKTKAKKAAVKPASQSTAPKLASGKVASAKQEKLIREKIALERENRESSKLSKQKAEAQEMAAVMARIDARAQGMRKTAPKAKAKSAIRSSLSLTPKKPAEALRDSRLELDRDSVKSAEIALLQQEKNRATTALSLTQKQTTPARLNARPGLNKEQKIAHTIARYRNTAEPAVNKTGHGQQELISTLQARLAQRNR
ncbi:hypothetical protein [Amphritea pacifica]|uniref:GIY-YIG nuclease family protein n=1 Tax=Amphritea pacifica TaxID=2811233 RepID=A0ABS2W471_9GAMM|nr:hypothetical protein [Amphritea pacifica]MBN0986506.1 hypothetical protein [Amphritea pacifica]MBN1006170.1 hypothetical protein [Amphritea pacifica]